MPAVMVHPDLPRQPVIVPDEVDLEHLQRSGWVELDQDVFPPAEPETRPDPDAEPTEPSKE